MARPTVPMGRLHGFTLVELMVALMVMALLSLMSWRGLDAMGRAQAQTQARADAVLSLQSGLAQWGADLDAMDTDLSNPVSAASAVAVTASTLPSAMDWNGLSLRITRHSNGTLGPSLRVVAWTLGDNAGRKTWLRWQSPPLQTRAELQVAWQRAAQWAQSPGADDAQREVRVAALDQWQIFYYRKDAWSNPMSSAGAASDGQTDTLDAVRLVLTLTPGQAISGTITRDWLRPGVGGGK